MGTYTEFHFNAELKPNIDKNIIEVLNFMLWESKVFPKQLPKHELFTIKDSRWKTMLVADSSYFSAATYSTLHFDSISESFFLCIRTNFKNYNNEIKLFIGWIAPYLQEFKGDFLGFYRHENDKVPTLIYMPEGEEKE